VVTAQDMLKWESASLICSITKCHKMKNILRKIEDSMKYRKAVVRDYILFVILAFVTQL